MGFWDTMARFFLGGHDENDEQPSERDYEEAEATDELTREGGEGEQYFNEGVDMGTVPNTPHNDGSDTDKHDTSWLRRLLGF